MNIVQILSLIAYNFITVGFSFYLTFEFIGQALFRSQSPKYGVGLELVFVPVATFLISTVIALVVALLNLIILKYLYQRIPSLQNYKTKLVKYNLVSLAITFLLMMTMLMI
jgi:hypothetical protein